MAASGLVHDRFAAAALMAAGYDISLLANVQPARAHLGGRFYRIDGVAPVISELLPNGILAEGSNGQDRVNLGQYSP